MSNKIWTLIAKFCAKPAVANWLIARSLKTPYFHIAGPDGSIYMTRWWLFNPYPEGHPKWQFPISIRIHHIMRPDLDRHQHDHPWNARTIIIRGWYVEERATGDRLILRNTSDTATLKFGEYHRIDRVSPGGVWTIFITGKYRGTWGFMVDGVKVPHREYVK